MSPLFTRTLKARLTTLAATLGLFMLTIGLAGILATRDSNTRMKSIYEDRAVPLAQLFEINDRMKDNTIAQYDAAANGRAGKPVGDIAGTVAGNIETISKVWTEYMATYLTPEEKGVADSFAPKRKHYVENAIKPALALLADRKYDEADRFWPARRVSCSLRRSRIWTSWSRSRSRKPRRNTKRPSANTPS